MQASVPATGSVSAFGPNVSRRLVRRGSVAAAMLLLTLTLSGCLSSGFTYVSHRNSDGTLLGFKLPANWKTYDTQQVFEAANGPLSSAEEKSIANGEWITAFSAKPASANAFLANGEHSKIPVGVVIALPLDETDRDGFSYSSMRSEFLGTDPLSAPSPDPYDVTAYNEFLGSGGLRGSRLTTNIKLSNGATAVFSQIVEVDADTDWVYGLGIECTASCWGPNAGVINQVLRSWSMKEIKG